MNVCAASAESKRGLSPKAETDSRICRVVACRLVPDPSPRHDLAGAAGHRRWPGRRRSDLPRGRRDAARAAEAGPSRARLRPVRDLPVARIAAGHPGAAASSFPNGNRSPIVAARSRLSARAAGAFGRRRPTARTAFPDLSLDFARRRLTGAGVPIYISGASQPCPAQPCSPHSLAQACSPANPHSPTASPARICSSAR